MKLNIDTNLLINDYNNGFSLKQIAKKYQISSTAVSYRFKKANVKIRPPEFYNTIGVNINFFDKIDSPLKAYWLGFLHADGYNNEKIGVISLTLHRDDLSAVEDFAKAIDYDGKVHTYEYPESERKQCPVAYLRFTSRHISKRLAELGCFQRKSLKTILLPEESLPQELRWHFMRGLFDGDGSIGKKSRSFSIVGGYNLCCNIKNFWESFGARGVYISNHKGTEAKTVTVSNIDDFVKVGQLLYKDSEGIRLERKFKLFSNYISEIKEKILKLSKLLNDNNIIYNPLIEMNEKSKA